MSCMCGDSQCPSCGRAQGTFEDMDAQEYIASLGIELKAQPVPGNPNMPDAKDMHHTHVTLRYKDREFTTYYSVGWGLVERWVKDHGPMWARSRLRHEHPRGPQYREIIDTHANRYRPEAWEVLECLLSDAASVEDRSFHEWCDDMGYDTDSMSARRTYDTILEQAHALSGWLGKETFQTLLYVE